MHSTSAHVVGNQQEISGGWLVMSCWVGLYGLNYPHGEISFCATSVRPKVLQVQQPLF